MPRRCRRAELVRSDSGVRCATAAVLLGERPGSARRRFPCPRRNPLRGQHGRWNLPQGATSAFARAAIRKLVALAHSIGNCRGATRCVWDSDG